MYLKTIIRIKPDEDYKEKAARLIFKKKFEAYKDIIKTIPVAMTEIEKLEKIKSGFNYPDKAELEKSFRFVSEKTLRMIENLETIAPDKYSLKNQYEKINIEPDTYIFSKQNPSVSKNLFTLPIAEKTLLCPEKTGAKLFNLNRLSNETGVKIPGGFIITTDAYKKFMQQNKLEEKIKKLIWEIKDLKDPVPRIKAIQEMIEETPVSSEISDNITFECRKFLSDKKNAFFTVRGSSIFEDLTGIALDGQYMTEPDIRPSEIIKAYKNIIKNQYSFLPLNYKLKNNLLDKKEFMAAGCFEMIDAVCKGIIYTRNPVNINDDTVCISLCSKIPGGKDENEFLKVCRKTMNINFRKKRLTSSRTDSYIKNSFSVPEETIIHLAQKAVEIEEKLCSPQDIQWAVDNDGSIYFLQTLPLKVLSAQRKNNNKTITPPRITGGITASPGIASGKVFKPETENELQSIKKESILVVKHALPAWYPYLVKAKGLIAEQGGITDQLVSIARELEIPTLTDINNACENLFQNEIITLDADLNAVFPGRNSKSAHSVKPEISKIIDCNDKFKEDIYTRITKLTLPEFKSSQINEQNFFSFHEIIRFIDEISAEEFFFFCQEFNFSQLRQKQLLQNFSINWKIIDLDNNFSSRFSKSIKPDKISSIPFLAFNEGITEAEKIPECEYSAVISRHFSLINLKSVFHHSTIEAIIGSRPEGNYAEYTFSEAAVDPKKESKRINFLNNFFMEQGFKTSLSKNFLKAETGKKTKDQMIKALKTAGLASVNLLQKEKNIFPEF
jgi:pyruvate,water dikinase